MGEILKKCTRCNNFLPRTRDYFTTNNHTRDGMAPQCKVCDRARTSAYVKANKSKWKEKERRYRAKHPEKVQQWRDTYNERLQNAVGSYTEEEWNNLCRFYGNKCLRCNKTTDVVADHVVPLSKGGTSFITNIQPLCKTCNAIKTDRDWDFRN